jgi:hypothetical protein
METMWQRSVFSSVLLLCVSCGAKTGLLVPEEQPVPNDAGPDSPEVCVDIDPDVLATTLDLEVTTRILSADVFFLVDCTGSMDGEIANIQRSLTTTIVPGALQQIPDLRLGVGAFADFAVGVYGSATDRPFELRRAITDDVAAVQAAIDALPDWEGGDDPESQVEALYQVATGEGFGAWVDPSPGCPRRGIGYPCFREGSQPVVMLITDAPFHNGPRGSRPYSNPESPPVVPAPHRFDDAMTALEELGARVVGIDSGAARADLEAVAHRTGAVDGEGTPLVYSISPTGVGLGEEVVRGIETLALRVPIDVDAIAIDVPGDDLDATVLIHEIIALRAEPPEGVARIEGDTFFTVMPGTRLVFDLDIRVDVIPTPPQTRVYPVLIRFRGNRVTVLREQIVYIEVPGLDGGDGC